MNRRIFSAILITALLCTLFVTSISASMYPAKQDDVCVSGAAMLEVSYKEGAPTIDGVVEDGEYHEIPAALVNDYYTYYVGPYYGENMEEQYNRLVDIAENKIKLYACWDGQYFYFAMTAPASQDEYTCTSDKNSVYLFRAWCAQFGFAAPDAVGENRYEIGVGASSEDLGDTYFYSWGSRTFKDYDNNEDYASTWDRDEEIVTYEVRADIAEVTGKAVENNCTMRFLYLMNMTGNYATDGTDALQIQSAYGCTPGKIANQFLLVTFTGLPAGVQGGTVADDEDPADDELPGFYGEIDCTDPDVVEDFDILNNMTVNYIAEDNGDMYLRFTATGENPYAGGTKLPSGLDAGKCPYIAIHYRTNSPIVDYIGVNYSSTQRSFDAEDVWDPDVPMCTDGEWYTAVLDMSGADGWFEFVQDFCFYFFELTDSEDSPVDHYVDVAWMKYYTEYPEFEDEYWGQNTDDDETTEAEQTTAPGAENTDGETTAAPQQTEEGTKGDETDEQSRDDGKSNTGLIIGIVAAAVVVVAVIVVIIVGKKKKA